MQAVGQYPTSKELAALVQRHASGKSAVDAAAYLAMAKDHAAANAQFEKDLKQVWWPYCLSASAELHHHASSYDRSVLDPSCLRPARVSWRCDEH